MPSKYNKYITNNYKSVGFQVNPSDTWVKYQISDDYAIMCNIAWVTPGNQITWR